VVLAGVALLASTASAYYFGVPPQCFDEYQCIYHRSNQPYTTSKQPFWSWDFRSLCKPAGQEYVAFAIPPAPSPGVSPSASPSPSYHPRIIFNICGTVAQVVAPYLPTPLQPGTASMKLPLPHSHGTAVQYLDDPGADKDFVCPDVDTCDQDTNPACLPGSLNYPPGGNPGNNPFSGSNPVPINRNPRREQRCASSTPPYYCTVQSVPCEGGVEIVAYYDGTGAIMTLYDEGTWNGVTSTSWQNGINLTFVGARPYEADGNFKCNAFDVTTGGAVNRNLNIFIGCNQGGKPSDPLQITGFTEEGQCQYYIQASHKLACGVAGDPYDAAIVEAIPGAFPVSATPARNWWFTCLGTFIIAPVIYIIYAFMDYKGYCDRVKYAIPSVATSWIPSWLYSSGGGSSSSGGSYSASYKAVGTAGSSTPISSAYGSA